jgi:tetratricopeptide (TPR) repeat protein
MLNKKRFIFLIVVGAVVVSVAFWVRHRVTTSFSFQLARALRDPRYRNLEGEVGRRQAAVAANPNNLKAHWDLADIYQKLELWELAADELDQIARLDPKNYQPIVGAAHTRLLLRQFDKAEQDYRKVTTLWPNSPIGWQGLAAALHAQGRAVESITAISHAVKLDPKNKNNRYIMASSILLYAQQFPDIDSYASLLARAKIELEKILPDWPMPYDIEYKLGTVCDGLRDFKGAVEHFRKACDLEKDRPDAIAGLARSYVNVGKRPMARKVIEDALKKFPNIAGFHNLDGELILASGEPDAAKKACEQFKLALKYDPNRTLFLDNLGSACVRANRLTEARDAFIKSVQIDPNRAYPYQQLAGVYTRLGNTALATAAAQQATHMVWNDQQLRRLQNVALAYPRDVRLQITLADRYRDLGMTGAARSKYLLVLQLEPNNKQAKDGLAALKQPQATAQQPATPISKK